MKIYVLIALLFVFTANRAFCQLNQSQSQIMQLMSTDNNWKFNKLGHNSAGEPYLSYRNKEKDWTKGFYFKNDSCGMINLIIPNNQLGDIIKDMNSKFTSKGNNVWTDDKNKIAYVIKLTDESTLFEVDELLISTVLKLSNSN